MDNGWGGGMKRVGERVDMGNKDGGEVVGEEGRFGGLMI